MKALLFGNPSAQSGAAAAAIARARELLEARGARVRVLATEPAGRTPGLVRDAVAAERPDVVIALGGDGTFREVASGLVDEGSRVPLGMMPMGTANDQGRSFGLEPGAPNLEQHVAIIAAGHVTELDVGRVACLDAEGASRGAAYFFDSLSFGLAPDILAARNRSRAEVANVPILSAIYRDQAVYVGAALDRLVASITEPTKFDAVIDTERWDRAWSGLTDLVIKATPIFAGAWVLDAAAEPDDGLFEVIAVSSRGEWVTRIVGDLAHGPVRPASALLGIPAPAHLAASRFDVRLYRPGNEAIASQIDGEEWIAGDRFDVRVDARGLPLLTPRDFVPPWRA